ncbi:M6 metalloprotease [Apiospora arundinis]
MAFPGIHANSGWIHWPYYPPEVVVRIVHFLNVEGTGRLTQASRAWHQFIQHAHREVIYASPTKVDRPDDSRDLAFLQDKRSLTDYFKGVGSWRELCKRQARLRRNWQADQPAIRGRTFKVGGDPVWRFRMDFKRRFIVSTSEGGGLHVTDMDTGELLWQLPRRDVRPFAHLEYDMERGFAAWDRFGNSIEIWKADDSAGNRGVFRQAAVLHHDCETRGYQLSYDTLCVVSSDGEGFVYDMKKLADGNASEKEDKPRPSLLRTHIDIEHGAVGHLDQGADAVVYSMARKGYHFHDKQTGASLGRLQPSAVADARVFHIKQPLYNDDEDDAESFVLESVAVLESQARGANRVIPLPSGGNHFVPLRPEKGRHPNHADLHVSEIPLEQDEWGAGMLSGSFMVGVSRAGRIFLCSDWPALLADPDSAAASSCTAIIETVSEGDSDRFDMGGWLSIRSGRICFEVDGRIYILTVPTEPGADLPAFLSESSRGFAVASSPGLGLSRPVSFMAVWDDCISFTYCTIGWAVELDRLIPQPVKAVRVLSWSPCVDGQKDVLSGSDDGSVSSAE